MGTSHSILPFSSSSSSKKLTLLPKPWHAMPIIFTTVKILKYSMQKKKHQEKKRVKQEKKEELMNFVEFCVLIGSQQGWKIQTFNPSKEADFDQYVFTIPTSEKNMTLETILVEYKSQPDQWIVIDFPNQTKQLYIRRELLCVLNGKRLVF